MIEAKINLLALVLNHKYNKYQILSINPETLDLPSVDIESYIDIKISLEHIISKISNDEIIYNFKLTDVTILDKLNIYYITFIYNDIKLNNYYYLLDINPHIVNMPDNAKKILTLF